jgi:hypothetical protein
MLFIPDEAGRAAAPRLRAARSIERAMMNKKMKGITGICKNNPHELAIL